MSVSSSRADCMDLFHSIAYVECHDSQSAATIKFWFDNKYISFLAFICAYMN